MTIRVHIVDDSAVMRQALSRLLETSRDIQVIGTSPDPIIAQRNLAQNWPDVIILDVEMPKMDGVTFLRKLMALRPTPVLMCSTLTEEGADVTLQAMAAGAVGYITKPKVGLRDFLTSEVERIQAAVREAAAARVSALKPATNARVKGEPVARRELGQAESGSASTFRSTRTTEEVIAIGTSTGGTTALETVLTALPRTMPGIVIVQHMPERFTSQFAKRLDSLCELSVKEGADDDRVLPGQVLIAPGGRHMELKRVGAQYRVRVYDGPPVNRHKPSVNVLFHSVANVAGASSTGLILTGMGDDGAEGLLAMRRAGSVTAGQNEESCVVYGMPRVAWDMGAVGEQLDLDQIASWLVNRFRAKRSA